MNRRKGFTLVELLVVIAIIALLMGILMPALARVRKQAKSAACMVQTKQWATVYSMYTGDSDGYFHYDWDDAEGGTGDREFWYKKLEPYYSDRGLLVCPSATKVRRVDASGSPTDGDEGGRNPNCAFVTAYDPTGAYDSGDTYKISCCINSWLCDDATPGAVSYDRPYEKRWITVNRFKQPNMIPLFGDAWGYSRLFPQAYTLPPKEIDTTAEDAASGRTSATIDRLMDFCLRRHGGDTNPNIDMAFGDFSVRPVGLKALWSINWHRKWVEDRKASVNSDMSDSNYDWPDWMKNFSSEGVINYQ